MHFKNTLEVNRVILRPAPGTLAVTCCRPLIRHFNFRASQSKNWAQIAPLALSQFIPLHGLDSLFLFLTCLQSWGGRHNRMWGAAIYGSEPVFLCLLWRHARM